MYNFIHNLNQIEIVLFSLIALLLISNFVLAVYLVFLRIIAKKNEIRKEQIINDWSDQLVNYLETQQPVTKIKIKNKKKLFLFADFILPYFRDMRGEYRELIIRMLYDLNLENKYISVLSNGGEWEKAYSCTILGYMHSTKAVPYLEKHSDDKSLVVSASAIESLIKIKDLRDIKLTLSNALELRKISKEKVLELLIDFKDEIIPEILSILKDVDSPPALKTVAADYAARRSILDASIYLTENYLRTNDRELQIALVKAMGRLEDPQSVELLDSLLNHSDNVIRTQAAKSLGFIGSEEVLHRLETLAATDNDFNVRLESIVAIRRISTDYLKYFEKINFKTNFPVETEQMISFAISDDYNLLSSEK